MQTIYFVLLLLAGISFGLSAAGVATRKFVPLSFVALGLFFWVLVPMIQSVQRL